MWGMQMDRKQTAIDKHLDLVRTLEDLYDARLFYDRTCKMLECLAKPSNFYDIDFFRLEDFLCLKKVAFVESGKKKQSWVFKQLRAEFKYIGKEIIAIRKEIAKQQNIGKKIDNFLHYPSKVISLISDLAIRDKWVQEGMALYRILICSNKVSIEKKKKYKNSMSDILKELIPNFRGQRDNPTYGAILSEYEYELERVTAHIKRNYRNSNAKKIALKELFDIEKLGLPDELKEHLKTRYKNSGKVIIDDHYTESNAKIARLILAHRYNLKDVVIANKLVQARKLKKRIK
jgi:hypothetical protein